LQRRTIAKLMLAAMVVAPILRFVVAHSWNSYAAYILMPCRMDCLAAGVLVAIAVRNPIAVTIARRLRPLLDAAALTGVAGILMRILLFRNVAVLYSIFAVVSAIAIFRIFLVEDGVYRRVLRNRVLGSAGLISYSLYLYHEPVNGIIHAILLDETP